MEGADGVAQPCELAQSRIHQSSEPADDFGGVGITDDDIPF